MPETNRIVLAIAVFLFTVLPSSAGESVKEARALQGSVASQQTQGIASNPDVIPLSDYTIIRFDKPLEQLRKQYRFGVFRDIESREIQWIKETDQQVKVPGRNDATRFLNIHYEVPGFGSFNGWWLKLENADWNPFRQWNLVLRMRLGESCTREFKLDLKTLEEDATEAEQYEAIVNISDRHVATMQKSGFFDVSIPMRLVIGKADLSRMYELVLVFENTRVTGIKGDLLIHSIRLAPRSNDEREMDVQLLLDQLARRAFLWFEAQRDAKTGLILDRRPNSPDRRERSNVSSMASVGYYLSMLPEAIRTGQVSRDEAEQRAIRVLSFVFDAMEHHEGLLYHFVDASTGKPAGHSEVSCLDSAILFNGCIVAGEAFGGRAQELGNALLDRANWTAFVVKHPKTGKKLLSLGWKPRKGLLGPMDARSSEMAMAYFLAVGSRTHPIDAQCWYNTTIRSGQVAGTKILNPTHPLFTSYYGLGWHRLNGLADREGIDLDRNAREAALANREFCGLMAEHHLTYSKEQGGWWGISAGDSPKGYVAPGPVFDDPNGTVWPTTALATVAWTPKEIDEDLDRWRKSDVWPFVSGPYGIGPFNLDVEWLGRDIIGIDLGSFYLNLANHRNGTVHELWMRHPVAKSALERLGYVKEE